MQRNGSMMAAGILALGLLVPWQTAGAPLAPSVPISLDRAMPWLYEAGGDDEESAATPAGPDLAGTNWLLEDIEQRGVIDDLQSTLAFDAEGKVSGSGGCNRFFGGVAIAGSSIKFGNLGSSMMACPPAVNDQEHRYFDALGRVAGWRIENGLLYLLDAGGQPLLRLSRAG